MEYDLYHDESQEAGYWHGILLVPQITRAAFLSQLDDIRNNTAYQEPVNLKRLHRTSGRRYRCVRSWLSFAVAALAHRLRGSPLHFYTGIDRPTPVFGTLESPIGAKFILFRVRDAHRNLTRLPDHGARVETTFRIGLKGGLHLLVRSPSRAVLTSLHFDGYEHHGRKLDRERIISRLRDLRDNVSINPAAAIYDQSSDHRKHGSQDYDDCQFLQLTDLLVGGFRTVLGVETSSAQGSVVYPLRQLARRWHEGPARMKNSRWRDGFCISECFLANDEWQFTDIKPARSSSQAQLFI